MFTQSKNCMPDRKVWSMKSHTCMVTFTFCQTVCNWTAEFTSNDLPANCFLNQKIILLKEQGNKQNNTHQNKYDKEVSTYAHTHTKFLIITQIYKVENKNVQVWVSYMTKNSIPCSLIAFLSARRAQLARMAAFSLGVRPVAGSGVPSSAPPKRDA